MKPCLVVKISFFLVFADKHVNKRDMSHMTFCASIKHWLILKPETWFIWELLCLVSPCIPFSATLLLILAALSLHSTFPLYPLLTFTTLQSSPIHISTSLACTFLQLFCFILTGLFYTILFDKMMHIIFIILVLLTVYVCLICQQTKIQHLILRI
jgi:hypothetical protein